MNKYKIEITETLSRIVEIEAENEDLAILKARADYEACEYMLDSDDYVGTDIEIYEE